jgi:hypothetical protein
LVQNDYCSRRPRKDDREGRSSRHIHNDKELEAYTNALFQLTALENPSASEVEAIELLTLLVERYEEAHYPILPRTPFLSCGSSLSGKALRSAI